ncbi:helix-turn-helix domain-containing protein [Promicromonospora sp. NPDC052451]|uniref:helix-turn-helix domain-containing protein n=1 Tax=Promicromonospora sp. NPDC052451 TaxID=3364407 RepID=UPI0037C59C99
MKADLGLMLADLRDAKGWSQQQLITEGQVRSSRSSIANTETGRQFPDERFWAECDRALGAQGELLAAYHKVNEAIEAQRQSDVQAARSRLSGQHTTWMVDARGATASDVSVQVSPPQVGPTDEVVEATRFASALAGGAVASEALEFTDLEIQRLSERFGSMPPGAMKRDLRFLQRSVFSMIERNRFPEQTRHLHLQAAQITGLTAHLLMDQGNYAGAQAMANVAWLCAEAAGHPNFMGWVRSVQSLIAYWNGNYAGAAALAADGMDHARSGTITVRLPGLLARSQGKAGYRSATLSAINTAEEARSRVVADHQNSSTDSGLFTFPERKQAGYAGTALLSLGSRQDIPRAIEQSNRAVQLELERSGGQAAGPDILAAYLDLTTAHLATGDLDGAVSTVQPVLAADDHHMTASIRKRLAELEGVLTAGRYLRSALAIGLRQELVELRAITDTKPGHLSGES